MIRKGVLLAVPLLLAVTWWAGRAPTVAPALDPATMWLAAADGHLVRANALVASAPAQIVEAVSFAGARSGVRLLPVAESLVVTAADGTLTKVDTRTYQAMGAGTSAAGAQIGTDGERIFLVRDDGVDVLDPDLHEVASHPIGQVAGWATAPGALYAATGTGAVLRVTATGAEEVLDTDATPLLAGVADGVAILDAGGEIRVARGTEVKTVARITAGHRTAFAAAPDGESFTVLDGRELLVVADGKRWTRILTFAPGDAPVLDRGVVHLADPAAGALRRFRIGAGLPEEEALRFGSPGRLDLDVHRNRQFVWFDDVRGPLAWVIHEGQPRKITKFRVRPPATKPPPPASAQPPSSPPPTSPPPSSIPPPPTSPPPAPPPSSPPPATSAARTPPPTTSTRSRSPSPSKSPTPTPIEDPRKRCDGEPTALEVEHPGATGARPRMKVNLCVPPGDGDEYWIVSLSQGLYFAKTIVLGEGNYEVRLLNGSGAPGQTRDFMIVAARTGSARDWLQDNLSADEARDGAFDRQSLPDGIETISARVPTTS